MDGPGIESRQGKIFFFPPNRQDRLWGPPRLLINEYSQWRIVNFEQRRENGINICLINYINYCFKINYFTYRFNIRMLLLNSRIFK